MIGIIQRKFWTRVAAQGIKHSSGEACLQVAQSGGEAGKSQFLIICCRLPETIKRLGDVVLFAIMTASNITPGMATHPAFHQWTKAFNQDIPGFIIMLQEGAVENCQAVLIIIWLFTPVVLDLAHTALRERRQAHLIG